MTMKREKNDDKADSPKNKPRGARVTGRFSGRPFNDENIGIPIRRLRRDRIRVTHRAVEIIERHLRRFVADLEKPERVMIARLRLIADRKLAAAEQDLNFYAHELREFVRYRRLGFETGRGDDWSLWNDLHTATLEDYGLREKDDSGNYSLYHIEAVKYFPAGRR
jgi:hypothetical protein